MKVTHKDLGGEIKTFECEPSTNALIGVRIKEVEMDLPELLEITEKRRNWFYSSFLTRFGSSPITIKITANETN